MKSEPVAILWRTHLLSEPQFAKRIGAVKLARAGSG